MVWLPEPKHIGAVLKGIGQNYKGVFEPSGREVLRGLKAQIQERKLNLKVTT